MRWASASATHPDLEEALIEVTRKVQTQLMGLNPDLVLVFVSGPYQDAWSAIAESLDDVFGARVMLGCSAGGVIGGGAEHEQPPAISVTAATLPNVSLIPFSLKPSDARDPLPFLQAAQRTLAFENPTANKPHLLIFPDPMTFHIQPFLEAFDAVFPNGVCLGGLASGGNHSGRHDVCLGRDIMEGGAVGVWMVGDLEVDTVVAQGCRPIGNPMFVTRVERNILVELDGRQALEVLYEIHASLDERDRELFRTSLCLGVVMHPDRSVYYDGDFLIRNLVGLHPQTGSLLVAAKVPHQSVVQFHVRDAQAASLNMRVLLERYVEDHRGTERPVGGVMFSCLGRGQAFYGVEGHETDCVREVLGELPITGFFCNGEIGPVQGTTFVHGLTCVLGFFRPGSQGFEVSDSSDQEEEL